MARKKSTKDLYAIKALLKRDMIGKNMTSHVMTERKVMSLSKTPYVVTLYYAFESKDYLFLVCSSIHYLPQHNSSLPSCPWLPHPV